MSCLMAIFPSYSSTYPLSVRPSFRSKSCSFDLSRRHTYTRLTTNTKGSTVQSKCLMPGALSRLNCISICILFRYRNLNIQIEMLTWASVCIDWFGAPAADEYARKMAIDTDTGAERRRQFEWLCCTRQHRIQCNGERTRRMVWHSIRFWFRMIDAAWLAAAAFFLLGCCLGLFRCRTC